MTLGPGVPDDAPAQVKLTALGSVVAGLDRRRLFIVESQWDKRSLLQFSRAILVDDGVALFMASRHGLRTLYPTLMTDLIFCAADNLKMPLQW